MNTREKIIRAGLKVFRDNGYEKATTRLIAREAGVNEVTLFRLFQNKESILMAVIQANAPVKMDIKSLSQRQTGDLFNDLVGLALGFYQGLKKNRKAVLMSLCAAEKYPRIKKIVGSGPKEQEKVIAEYFSGLQKRKIIRDLDPVVVARQFIEMLFGLCVSSGLRKSKAVETESTIRKFVDVFINGIGREKS
jgi:AcrR family transcriptional regulator